MEGCRDNRIRGIALAALAMLWLWQSSGGAQASPPPADKGIRTSVVYTTPDSAVVEADIHGDGSPSASATTTRPKRDCHLEALQTTVTGINGTLSLPVPDGEAPFWLICDGQQVGIVMRKLPSGPRPGPATPRDVAQQLREEVPIPQVGVRANPGGEGMVGVESFFWIDGYDGRPILHSTNAFGSLIEVEARVTQYRWTFGDGSSLDSQSLGRAYPERSEIRHAYERSSSGSALGFPIDVDFFFSVRYRVDGGAWISLAAISRTAHLDYPVRESQVVIVR